MNVNFPVNLVAGFSGIALLLQSGSEVSNAVSNAVGPVERLTLTAALLVAVRVLWQTTKEDRRQIITMANKATEASTRFMEVTTTMMDRMDQFEKTADEIGAALDNFADQIATQKIFDHVLTEDKGPLDPKVPRSKVRKDRSEARAEKRRHQQSREDKGPDVMKAGD